MSKPTATSPTSTSEVEATPAFVRGWLVSCKIPCEDVGPLVVKGAVRWRDGFLAVSRVSDVRGDYFQITWVNAQGDPKSVNDMTTAFAMSYEAGQIVVKEILLRANPQYDPMTVRG